MFFQFSCSFWFLSWCLSAILSMKDLSIGLYSDFSMHFAVKISLAIRKLVCDWDKLLEIIIKKRVGTRQVLRWLVCSQVTWHCICTMLLWHPPVVHMEITALFLLLSVNMSISCKGSLCLRYPHSYLYVYLIYKKDVHNLKNTDW